MRADRRIHRSIQRDEERGGEASRREFLRRLSTLTATWLASGDSLRPPLVAATASTRSERSGSKEYSSTIRLFLCGDVMTGRGIDQILPHPNDPRLYESWVKDARTYVELAERAHGRVPREVDWDYVWGDLPAALDRAAPDARIVNLETAVTTSDDYWPGKGIHYRMHPENVPCLTAAKIDCCVLANNHVLDWGTRGLLETLDTLAEAGIATAGAGRDREEAARPAVLELDGGGRVLVFAFGHPSSGIPLEWEATDHEPGIALLSDLSPSAVSRLGQRIAAFRRPDDLVVASIHWGGNWGYEIPAAQQRFARALVEEAGVDVVHGHSSHHVKGIGIHRERPILYGCGDFLTDYEGISGHEQYRDDLVLAYLPSFERASGRLSSFALAPFRLRRLRLDEPDEAEIRWLATLLERESESLGARIERTAHGWLELSW